MKKSTWLLLSIILIVLGLALTASAETNQAIILPGHLTAIEAEAFKGDTTIGSVVIPKTVNSIGSQAFADCKGLKEIYFGNGQSLEIANDAFAGCDKTVFYVYPKTPAELFVLAHGYPYEYIEQGGSTLQNVMTMVSANGRPGDFEFESGSPFATKRLIVQRTGNRLPDISAYNPIGITLDEDNVFMIQFSTIDDASNCYAMLHSDAATTFVEADQWVSVVPQEIVAAGVVDPNVWNTDDPMGFDVYSPFVAKQGTGSITIAVIDSGIAMKAPYSAIIRNDGINMMEHIDGESWEADSLNHGSVIASVIKDCVGNANVKILPVRITDSTGYADLALIAEGIDYAVSHGAKIINLSWKIKTPSACITKAINQAVQAGVTVVVAAGNDGTSISKVYPANLSNVITVSGIDMNYGLWQGSNYGAGVDYCAPANYIKTSAFTGTHDGTSFAAPMICSALALVRLDNYHTVADMNDACRVDLDTDSPSGAYGKGMPMLDRLAVINAQKIVIDSDIPAKMAVGQEIELAYHVLPETATNKNVIIDSENRAVMTVTTNAQNRKVLRAVGAGTANLVLTCENSEISVTVPVTVVQPVKSIVISGGQEKLILGHTMQLRVNVLPANATAAGVEWCTTDAKIATVAPNGLVTPVSVGTVGIYAVAADGYGAKSDTLRINVIDIPDAESITLYRNNNADDVIAPESVVTIVKGQSVLISAKVNPAEAMQDVRYETFPYGVASVTDDGLVTAEAVGQTGLNVATWPDGSVRTRITIEVVVLPDSITVSGAKTTLDAKETVQFTANVLPADATDKAVKWSSSKTGVATVNAATGLVTAVAPGTAFITATSVADPSVSGTLKVTVRQPYTLMFDANGGTCSETSRTAYSGAELGALPTPVREYYVFAGWYTAKEGGTAVNSSSKFDSSDTYTIYAHWTGNPVQGWVKADAVPDGAKVVATSWSYHETQDSTSATPPTGFTLEKTDWKEVGKGTSEYAIFPSTYNKNDKYYTASTMLKSKPVTSETATERIVYAANGTRAGWIYWHWMYNVSYAAGTGRTISHRQGNWNIYGVQNGDSYYAYIYFYSMKSTVDCSSAGTGYCCSQGITSYDCNKVVQSFASAADKASETSGLGTDRFFRFEYYTIPYTKYVKNYIYGRDVAYNPTDPGNGANITQKVQYVKYQLK